MQEPKFSDRLRLFIKSKSMSIRAFATTVQIPYKSMQEYTAGNRYPGGEHMARLAGFGADVNWLLTGNWSSSMQHLFKDAPEVSGVLADYPELAYDFMDWCIDGIDRWIGGMPLRPGEKLQYRALLWHTFQAFRVYSERFDDRRDFVIREITAGKPPRDIVRGVLADAIEAEKAFYLRQRDS